MTTLDVRACAERILSIRRPLLLMHVRPDGDTVGSAAGLAAVFRALGREVKFACADKIPDRLAFLLPDALTTDFEGLEPIAVDVASRTQLGSLADEVLPILTIDHHEVSTPFSDHFTVAGESSVGEVLCRLVAVLEEMGKLRLTKEIAYPLYAAISSDTGCFRYSNTTGETMRRAARLMETGIDCADVNHRLFESKSPEILRAEGFAAANMKAALSGRIAYTVITLADCERLSLLSEHLETVIDVVRSRFGTEVAFVVKEASPGNYKISLRSTGYDVAAIAARFGGGGHIRAAGCSVAAGAPEDAAEKILAALGDLT